MSHFQRIRTQIREREQLTQALTDLHYRFQEGESLTVRGFVGAKERAEIVVETGCSYDIGFQKREETFEVVADWWGVSRGSNLREASFLQQVQRQYAYNVVREQAREQNWIIEEERELDNGEVVFVFADRG